jgi:hypothetical protein
MTFYFNKCSTRVPLGVFSPSMGSTHNKKPPSRNFVITMLFFIIFVRSFVTPTLLQKTKKTMILRLFCFIHSYKYTPIHTLLCKSASCPWTCILSRRMHTMVPSDIPKKPPKENTPTLAQYVYKKKQVVG